MNDTSFHKSMVFHSWLLETVCSAIRSPSMLSQIYVCTEIDLCVESGIDNFHMLAAAHVTVWTYVCVLACRISIHLHSGTDFFLRGWRITATTATTESTTESGSKLARSTTFLALSSITSAVSTLTVTSSTSTATALTVVTTHHSTGRSVRALLLDVSRRHDLSWQVKPFTEVVETLRSQGVVIVLP